ncbi:galactose-1-phosphate uridylyltransferase [Saccharomonospora viridis]|uniref:Galactose-1-phosphate uridylyltransferase n=4 Tax=Saccharomonospora viridis TaxID=1852 RepID=C7MZL5_SACVD|nr:galactose-1-phosphate uridylyltransferase [Saccharomonospora viridis]ACU98244.1 galactose-1-phosphate uridylyltransferase, family 1 [Saccharomonospora viridis DSM 43017]KHF42359.1 galactose-1-phosphate uridylyltransferase [Saccharomonospora viridis]SFP93217.1 UDPglucose--hexose-1-phosphate uridylyltransferase [Saccharomonospora viridis]
MNKTVRRLADGRRITYYDEVPRPEGRTAVDTRDLPPVSAASEVRRDPLTGEEVVIAAHRQSRTYKPPADLCPLCPTAPGRLTEVPERDYDVVVFDNRFPAFAGGAGHADVVCFTSDHSSSFAELSPRRVRTVLEALADRTAELSTQDGVEQVFPFENRGEEIGVTLHHPHGQIYAYPFVPPRTERMLAVARAHRDEYGGHVLGDVLAAEHADRRRTVVQGEHWTAFVPPAARWPVHVLVVPHRRVADLTELDTSERDDFAEVYLSVLRRCDALYGRPLPYVAGWHQAPVRRDRDLAWLHLELFSVRRAQDKLKYLAGSESGMAVWINDSTPEQIADRLRAVG